MSRQPMSMEAMLDEERREVLALLEGSKPRAPRSMGARSPSPMGSPQSPVRSMLDVGDVSPPPRPTSSSPVASRRNLPVRSMLDIDNSSAEPVRSMLDVDTSIPATKVFSNPTIPLEPNYRAYAANAIHHSRSLSDAASNPVEFGPRSSLSRVDPTAGYQFSGIITPTSGHPLPTRASQGGKRNTASSMAEVMRGTDVSNLVLPGDRGRNYPGAGPSARTGNKSKSPHGRSAARGHSPANLLIGRNLSPAGRALVAESAGLDMNNAYRRLSDAHLARSSGSLAEFGRRKKPDDTANGGRMVKDYLAEDDEDGPEDSSDDHEDETSSDDEGERGRQAARSFEGSKHSTDTSQNKDASKSERKTLSLLAAAEEERIQVASQQPSYKYRSLLDEPEITVTNPSGERIKQTRTGVHPATSFDEPPPSGSRTPVDSDTEADLTDIKRAQKLSFSMTPVMSTPESHRAIRIIYRGEYSKVVQDAEEEHRRLRKYLVATDLSEESAHALEWAVGTVLRDGDTLICIYCVDEETGIVTGDNALVPDEPKAMREQANAINTVTGSRNPISPSGSIIALQQRASPLLRATDTAGSSLSPEPSIRERTKAEEERHRAVQDITDRVTKLLRKTRLQVRVIVEVLHCKNPKHLITEVIDIVNPTLVILGSRGRSALKGVILGSFSNYLVTKSSVPVMVARKRLRKQSKYKRAVPHQVNNISSPAARSLANAKID
ncbi:Usp family protein [Pleurostoma richardsiae]|uniref:Usp family protein n=1 Tax=Pleurostoma richardsiae TaxID=41990 RepID=A0AA38VHH2_9PEZI|nr:Usp family protein [Pleurostoma richardsiae]